MSPPPTMHGSAFAPIAAGSCALQLHCLLSGLRGAISTCGIRRGDRRRCQGASAKRSAIGVPDCPTNTQSPRIRRGRHHDHGRYRRRWARFGQWCLRFNKSLH
jgi:hypothetical protein